MVSNMHPVPQAQMFVLLIALASCSAPVIPLAQKAFPTTSHRCLRAALRCWSLVRSGRSGNGALLAIFGPDGEKVLYNRDVQDTRPIPAISLTRTTE